ncbi:AAA family ATPase [Methylobacterium sp. WL12]|uniref:AAA family ATPase n=1 Tax=Methylobacterium sp. WL12 TaxID=2603890 RepID=UPI0011CB7BBF|nr:AAA family ATPase [Methylobacterium sp. WL12]TXM74133.1 AAA family ATPase [Methylobacterium sp. WL12]
MTDDPQRWARRAARIVTYADSEERLRTDLGNRPPSQIPSVEEILVGYPWVHGNLDRDIEAWSTAVGERLAPALPEDLMQALAAFRTDAEISTGLVLESLALRHADAGCRPPHSSFDTLDALREIADRMTLYLAEMGDPGAVARAVALCIETLHAYATVAGSDPCPVREIGVTLTAYASRIPREPGAIADTENDVDPSWVSERRVQRVSARTLLETLASTVAAPELMTPVRPAPAKAAGLDMSWLADVEQAAAAPSILVLPAAADGKKPKGQAGTIAGRRLPCAPMPDLQDLGQRLVERTPWAEAAVSRIVGLMMGRPYAAVPNILLVGPPGGGKTSLARDLVAAMGVPSIVYACASASDSSFGGTAAQWSTARPSVMAQLPITSGSATGVVILDELEKSPAAGGHNGSLREVLLGLAEPSTRRAYWDIGLETAVDLSGISLVATANDVLSLRGPLLDRFVTIDVGTPRRRDLPVLVRGILDDLRADVADARWIPDLDGTEIDALAGAWRGGSIRPLRRAVERIVALRSSPRLAH